MRPTGIKITAILLLILLSAITVVADGKTLKGSFSVPQTAQVNGVALEPGNYDVKFNAETNEVTISKGNRVRATATASIRSGEEKINRNQAFISSTDKGYVLSKLVFKGDDRAIILSESGVAKKQ